MIEWKCIDEFPDYEISTSAEVRNKVTMQVLRQVNQAAMYKLLSTENIDDMYIDLLAYIILKRQKHEFVNRSNGQNF